MIRFIATISLALLASLVLLTGGAPAPTDAMISSVAETCKLRGQVVRVFANGAQTSITYEKP